jgi:hypothetical protein
MLCRFWIQITTRRKNTLVSRAEQDEGCQNQNNPHDREFFFSLDPEPGFHNFFLNSSSVTTRIRDPELVFSGSQTHI